MRNKKLRKDGAKNNRKERPIWKTSKLINRNQLNPHEIWHAIEQLCARNQEIIIVYQYFKIQTRWFKLKTLSMS